MALGKNQKKNFFSEWLEKLQQESWQLELLISGLALFGIWESRGAITEFNNYFNVNGTASLQFYQGALISILRAGWIIFFVNLLIHIIVRGLWIGAIGLRYVSGDIDYEQLKYSDTFVDYYKDKIGTYDNYIERLEKLSSILFSYTFLLFFMFVSFVIVNLFFIIIITILDRIFEGSAQSRFYMVLFGMLFYGIGFLVLLDFLTLGMFKKIQDKTVSRVYLFIYRFYSAISLSFIYRPLLLNFIDNRYTRRLFFLAIPYTLIILLGFKGIYMERYTFLPSFSTFENYQYEISRTSINWRYYDDLRLRFITADGQRSGNNKRTKISFASLESYETEKDHITVFLEFRQDDDKMIERNNPDLLPFRKKGLRHRIFMKNRVPDPDLKNLQDLQSREIVFMRKVLRKQLSSIDSTDEILFQNKLSYYQSYSEDDFVTLRREIRDYYSGKESVYMSDKLELIKNELLQLYDLRIDSISYQGRIESHFYTHSNLGERGLICELPIDSLPNGIHVLQITKTGYKEDCDIDCPKRNISIPFRKNSRS